VRGHDELAVLAERFNSMIERIRQGKTRFHRSSRRRSRPRDQQSLGRHFQLRSDVAAKRRRPCAERKIPRARQGRDGPDRNDRYQAPLDVPEGRPSTCRCGSTPF
jgi:hypothetical protein